MIFARPPTWRIWGGSHELEAGNYDLKRATGALNAPLSQKAALRVAFDITDRGGYFSDGTGDDEHQAGRAQLKLVPSDSLKIVLRADYAHQGGKGSGGTAWCAGGVTPGRPKDSDRAVLR